MMTCTLADNNYVDVVKLLKSIIHYIKKIENENNQTKNYTQLTKNVWEAWRSFSTINLNAMSKECFLKSSFF